MLERENNVGAGQQISIIIPYYNTGKYLGRCLDSIVSQSYENLEIILVDDGSSDNSPEIASEYAKKDPRVKALSHEHGGVSSARNFGLSQAKGEIIMFADADDWLAEGMIERMMKVMSETEADIVTCNIRRVSDISEKTEWQEGYTVCDRDEYMRIFFRIGSNEIVHYPVAKLYKRELLQDDIYPVGIRIGEDMVGTYRAIKDAGKIVRMNGVGYYYFYTPGGATDTFGEKNFDLIEVWDTVVKDSEGREPDHEYAVLNRKRINFGLLFLMVSEVPAKERKTKYAEQIKQLRSDLKACEKDLLNAPIVKSRKILIYLLANCYPLVSFAGDLYNKFAKLTGRKLAVGNRSNLS